jgi:hypothetical protein
MSGYEHQHALHGTAPLNPIRRMVAKSVPQDYFMDYQDLTVTGMGSFPNV